MLKKILTIITLCTTLTLHATPGAIGTPIDVTSLHDIVYEYDKLGRVTKATYASGESIGYSYDAGGNLLGVVFDDPNAVTDKLPVIEEFSVINPDACFVNNSCEFKIKAIKGDNFLDGGYSVSLSGEGSCGGSSKSAVLGWGNEDISTLDETTVLDRRECNTVATLKVYDVKELYSEKSLILPTTATDTDKDGEYDVNDLDDDGDGISDLDEEKYGLNSLDASDAILDSDGDGVSNIDEIKAGTDPLISDKIEISLLKLWKYGKFSHIVRNENYLYVVTYDYKIKILDIQDINNISVIGEVQLELDDSDYVKKLVYDNGYLYVAEDKYINIINVKNASTPIVEKEFKISGQWISKIALSNHQLYVAYWVGGSYKIDKYSLTQPTSPSLVSSLVTHVHDTAFKLRIQGDYLYILFEDKGVEIVDISQNTMKHISFFEQSGWFKDMQIKGSKVYIADWQDDQIFIIDISDKSNPKALSSIQTNGNPSYIALVGDYTLWEDTKGLELGSSDFSTIEATYSTIENFSYVVYKNYILGVNSNGLKVIEVKPSSLFDIQDSDGDGYNDDIDAFPNDKNEWLDTDEDGTGNNVDLDDDGDGISDEDEKKYGFDPLNPDDADEDSDGDGVSNIDEIKAGTNLTDKNDYPQSKMSNEQKALFMLLLNRSIELNKDNVESSGQNSNQHMSIPALLMIESLQQKEEK